MIDKLDMLEQGKDAPEIQVNKEFYQDQNVKEVLALQEEDDVTGLSCYQEKHPEPRQFLSNPSCITCWPKVKHRRERKTDKNGALPTKSAGIKTEIKTVWQTLAASILA